MDNIRVSELAKELGMTSKEVIEKFNEVEIMVKSHSNTVTPTQIRNLKEHLGLLPKKSNAKPKAFIVKKSKTPVAEVKQEAETKEVKKTEAVKVERVEKSKPVSRIEVVRKAPKAAEKVEKVEEAKEEKTEIKKALII